MSALTETGPVGAGPNPVVPFLPGERDEAVRSAPNPYAIDLANLTRRFGSSRVLNGVSLQILWDQRVALLGANGAGKTTLLRILATLARPTAGHLTIGGLPLPEQAGAVRRHLGYVGHQTFLYDELTIRENLTFYGRLYRVAALPDRITAVLGQVGLAERADDRVRALSRGLQQRASLTRAILHDPPILLLDEPDTGLDVSADHVLRSLFADDRGRPRTVILTTHNLERALALTDRVVVLDRGRIVLDRPSATVNVAQVAGAIRGETRLR